MMNGLAPPAVPVGLPGGRAAETTGGDEVHCCNQQAVLTSKRGRLEPLVTKRKPRNRRSLGIHSYELGDASTQPIKTCREIEI